MVKNPPSAAPERSLSGRYNLALTASPNPTSDQWNMQLRLPRTGNLQCTLQNAQGKILRQVVLEKQAMGECNFSLSANGLDSGIYWLTVNLDGVYMETKAILKQGL
ncbi:MAG: T9SS type A sorting domain-containing protein [Saprospiraceae bacterium]|nr:T9SS type A sorting domain-containing protein [Saprospiraceae bacterium]